MKLYGFGIIRALLLCAVRALLMTRDDCLSSVSHEGFHFQLLLMYSEIIICT